MGDHFVLLVDRLLTEATLEAAIESRNRMMQATASSRAYDDDDAKVEKTYHKVDLGDITNPGKLVECRICQDEDVDSNMETPCSCCGSLKYAHRKCIQRWCNEKGNTICEICQQQFKPGYTAPPPLFQLGRIPVNFRGNWESSRRDIHGPRIIAVVSTGQDYTNSVSDEYSASTARNVIYCRLVAIIFMTLLLLRHTLPLILSGDVDISFPLFVLLFARVAGIVLPIYVMARALTAFQHRRRSHHYHQEPPNSSIPPSDEEAGTRIPHPEA